MGGQPSCPEISASFRCQQFHGHCWFRHSAPPPPVSLHLSSMTVSFLVLGPAPEWTQTLSMSLANATHTSLSLLQPTLLVGGFRRRKVTIDTDRFKYILVTLTWKSPLALAPFAQYPSMRVPAMPALLLLCSSPFIPAKPTCRANSLHCRFPSRHVKPSPPHTRCPGKMFFQIFSLKRTLELTGK